MTQINFEDLPSDIHTLIFQYLQTDKNGINATSKTLRDRYIQALFTDPSNAARNKLTTLLRHDAKCDTSGNSYINLILTNAGEYSSKLNLP